MNMLVTGGAGFIGSNFIRYWLDTYPEDHIVNLDALTYAGNLENLSGYDEHPHYRFIKGSITSPEVVAEAMEGVDTVVHFAAETHVDRSILGPKAFIETNITGTYVLLEAARLQKVRFHHVSTDEVYGSLDLGSRTKFTRTTAYDPSSPYSASKAASDHLVRAYHRTYGVSVTISNCSNNFGPYQFPEKFIPLVITNAMESQPVPVYGNGLQVRDWLFVEDHCRAIDLILQQGEVAKTYLVGGLTEDISNLTVAKKILAIMGKPESLIEHVTDRPGHDVRYAIDWSQSQAELGYQPKASFDEYLEKTVRWYLDHETWWKRVKTGEYQDYYQQQYGER
jgi:dTDP-glucose 4,6-dehydratase